MKAWSRSYENCLVCGTHNFIYYGNGICISCFRRSQNFRKKQSSYLSVKKWREAHPERRIAHRIVYVAVRNGSLKKGPCEVCGETKIVHAHHEDYSKPLEIKWLCPFHHGNLTSRNRLAVSSKL